MNNEIKESIQIISEVFPVSYANTDFGYKHFHTSTSGIKHIFCKGTNKPEYFINTEPRAEMERYEDLDVIELTSNRAASQKKYSFYIGISKLEIEPTDSIYESRNVLCNRNFIASYMRLSQREKEVLKQLALMKTSEEIASQLCISPNTVKNHRRNIRQKVEFVSREESSRFLYWVRGFVS
ncbi:hypothetical protein G3O08_09055 [Cryomorpha ignava]|uniref:HTH luxR-type domain-containing protein n=1 Tax=Cryomorpha ignava TaxID=101383 RepID=A0A7K3WPR6_9FLAO|nr:helix-turn-helix transcriptional regulator [Cryomorpha ignava]NEN23649.1 hypothetical protein [Cryomorpha ignava]